MLIEVEKYVRENSGIKKVVLNQTWGLGDILFIERIYNYLHQLGLEVIAPVQDECIWIQDHIDYVKFVKASEYRMDYERFDFGILEIGGERFEDTLYLPTRFSDQIFRNLRPHDPSASRYWMTDKYNVLGLEPKIWEGIRLTRNLEKEKKLKDMILTEFSVEGDYDFCNSNYRNDVNINLEDRVRKDLPVVSMRFVEGFSMIDWSSIIESARIVHTVHTSLMYMIQSIYQPGKEYNLYPRYPEPGFYTVEEFLPDYWIRHY